MSRRLVARFAVPALLLVAVASTGFSETPAAPASPSSLNDLLDDLVSSRALRGAKVGLVVAEASSGEMLYERNAQARFIPASNLKLFTAAAALSLLRPDYQFETPILADAAPRAGRVEGNLYLRGSGDPSLVMEEMWAMVLNLKAAGVRRVTGGLVIDQSYFDRPGPSPGGRAEPGARAFASPLAALSVNFNSIGLDVRPGGAVGEPAVAALVPQTSAAKLVSRARTGKRGSRSTIVIRREAMPAGDRIVVTGRVPLGIRDERRYVSLSDPTRYAGLLFKEFAAAAEIEVKGPVRSGTVPAAAVELLRHRSAPLSEIVRDVNKFSNNFMADQLVKTLGAERRGPPGTIEKGISVVAEFMESVGIPKGEFRLADGSGLSRGSRLAPGQIVRLLVAMYGDFDVGSEFVSSLGVLGADGTLRDRLRRSDAAYRIRAKTGSLKGVRCLAGYARIEGGGVAAFSLMVNDYRASYGEIERWEDRFIERLVSYRGERMRSMAERREPE